MPLSMRRRVQELVRKAAEKAGVTIERIVADDAGRPGYPKLVACACRRSPSGLQTHCNARERGYRQSSIGEFR
jgi:hypothetical protein